MTAYHSIELPDGTIRNGVLTLDYLKYYLKMLSLPNLNGKTVLDIGAAEGFYSIEFAKAGAFVTALNIDFIFHDACVENVSKYKLNINPHFLSAYDILNLRQQFDIVCMLGLIYHLQNPFLVINLATSIAKELVVIESYFSMQNTFDIPYMIFFKDDQLNNDPTNWWGPSVLCIEQMLLSAGCRETKVKYINTDSQRVIIHGYK